MKRENFQNNNLGSGNESLDTAYSDESLNIISNNSVFNLGNNSALEENTAAEGAVAAGPATDFHNHIELEDAKFDFNIWDLLGVKSLGKNKHNCLLDCGIQSLNSMEKCNENNQLYYFLNNTSKEKCKMTSYRTALECSKKCYNLDPETEYTTPINLLDQNMTSPVVTQPIPQPTTTPTPPTEPVPTTEVINMLDQFRFPSRDVPGVYSEIDTYSPHESKYWPDQGKFGWNVDDIVEYNKELGDEVIEVQSRQFFPSNTEAPYLEFKNLI